MGSRFGPCITSRRRFLAYGFCAFTGATVINAERRNNPARYRSPSNGPISLEDLNVSIFTEQLNTLFQVSLSSMPAQFLLLVGAKGHESLTQTSFVRSSVPRESFSLLFHGAGNQR